MYTFIKEILFKALKNKKLEIKCIARILTGYTNSSFLVTLTNKKMYVVRIPTNLSLIDREKEHQVLKKLNNDKDIYFDKKSGIYVKEWIDGVNPVISKKWKYIDQLFTFIKKLHSVQLSGLSKLKSLTLSNKNLKTLRPNISKLYLSLIKKYKKDKLVLNHCDINASNIIQNGTQLYVIDYEWSALANDYWDYANFIRETKIDFKKIKWDKYIQNFDLSKLLNFIFMTTVYAYLWTWQVTQTPRILEYRKNLLDDINWALTLIK